MRFKTFLKENFILPIRKFSLYQAKWEFIFSQIREGGKDGSLVLADFWADNDFLPEFVLNYIRDMASGLQKVIEAGTMAAENTILAKSNNCNGIADGTYKRMRLDSLEGIYWKKDQFKLKLSIGREAALSSNYSFLVGHFSMSRESGLDKIICESFHIFESDMDIFLEKIPDFFVKEKVFNYLICNEIYKKRTIYFK